MYYINPRYVYNTFKYNRSGILRLEVEYTDGTTETITSDYCKQDSFYIDARAVNGNSLEFGSSYMTEMGITLFDKKAQINKFDNATIKPYVLVSEEESGDLIHDIPMGVFIVDSTELINNSDLRLTCYDQMKKLNKKMSGGVSGDLYDVVSKVCRQCGVTLALNRQQFRLFSGDTVTYAFGGGAFNSCRDIIEDCAEIMCCFAYFDRIGRLMFRKFGKLVSVDDSGYTLPLSFINYANFDYYDYKISNIIYATEDLTLNSSTGNDDGFEITFGLDNKLFKSLWDEHKNEKQTVIAELGPSVKYINYRGASVKIWNEPTIDIGDFMTIEGYGNIYVMHYRYTLHGLQDIDCYGISKDLYRGRTALQRRINDVSNSQESIRFNISTCVINNQQVEPIVQTRNMVRAIKSRSVSAIPSNYTTVVESDYSVNSTNIYLANVLNVYAENDCTLTYFNVIHANSNTLSTPVVCRHDIKAGYTQICWNDCIEFEYIPEDLSMTVGIGVTSTDSVSILEDGSKIIVFSLLNGSYSPKTTEFEVFNSNITVTATTVTSDESESDEGGIE